MRKIFWIALIILFTTSLAWGLQQPHYLHEGIGCSSCHMFRNPIGPNATKATTNYGLCRQCHNESDSTMAFPFVDAFKSYTVGISGAFHKWNVYTSNSNYGASAPSVTPMFNRIQDGKIVCSVCHDQHANNPDLRKVGRLRKSSVDLVELGGPGTISYTVANGVEPKGWHVRIATGGSETTATFEVSMNAGKTWYGWESGSTSWVIGAPPKVATATPQAIDNDLTVFVSFSGTGSAFVANQEWSFYYAYPFLRTFPDSGDNVTGKRFCRACHSQRAQTHYRAGNVWDGQMKSHPVGVSLNSNGGGYDRKPLDVDGTQQGVSTDTNWTNDLLLFGDYTAMLSTFGNISSGDVQCMSCHAPHWTDSNSQTVDLR